MISDTYSLIRIYRSKWKTGSIRYQETSKIYSYPRFVAVKPANVSVPQNDIHRKWISMGKHDIFIASCTKRPPDKSFNCNSHDIEICMYNL